MKVEVFMMWFLLSLSASATIVTFHLSLLGDNTGVMIGSIEAVAFGVFTLIARQNIINQKKGDKR